MHEDTTRPHANIECRNLLSERRRRGARVGLVFIAVPRTHDTVIDYLSFAQRAVLVLADIRDRGDPAVVPEDRDTFAGDTGHHGTLFRNLVHAADVNESIPVRIQVLA